MSLFATAAKEPDYVALLDIGSGSVTATISSTDEAGEPFLIWSTQERVRIRDASTSEHAGKQLMTCLMNVALALGDDGLQTLRMYDHGAKLKVTQVSVSAPWSYTITKRAKYAQEKPFSITDSLIEEILTNSDEKILKQLHEHENNDGLSLDIVSRTVTGLYANDYLITNPRHQSALSFRVTQSDTVLQTHLIEFIRDVHNKVLPKTELRIFSFVLMLYYVLRDIHPEMQEYCVINQTLEATELGVVRDGAVVYCTHDTYGIASLVREVADATDAPVDATYSHLQQNTFEKFYESLSQKRKDNVDSVLSRYQNVITDLLNETGDSFTIPKSIYLHSMSCTYDFFARHIEKGAERTTGFGHIVHNIDTELLHTKKSDRYKQNARSCVELVSSRFFHKYRDPYGFIKT
jgi:hypothetical protein